MNVERVTKVSYFLGNYVEGVLYDEIDWYEVFDGIDFSNGYRAVKSEVLTAFNSELSRVISNKMSFLGDLFKFGDNKEEALEVIEDKYGISSTSDNRTGMSNKTTSIASAILGSSPKKKEEVKDQVVSAISSKDTFTQAIKEMFDGEGAISLSNFKKCYLTAVNRRLNTIKKE